ncbi:UNVERIFIED_CONTAM: hypothetical protein PYX00_006106 [Menopon gallinae]|uniref:Elongation of very long chain fatty acids protein n=1 Tax=Menopon gallinae TaxID=328185 RepID=A0AAW2HW20_9NEOP
MHSLLYNRTYPEKYKEKGETEIDSRLHSSLRGGGGGGGGRREEKLTPHVFKIFQTIRLCHIYFLSKITELADTVFFVLKKKHKHISLLHVFHHAAMPFSVWFGVKYHPGGNLAFFGLPNLFVHTWMYLYYFVAALGPKYQKYIWWKRHITQMQLAQFIIVMMYMLFVAIKCDVNKTLLLWTILMDIAFVVLFVDFYWKTYVKKKGASNGKSFRIRDPIRSGMIGAIFFRYGGDLRCRGRFAEIRGGGCSLGENQRIFPAEGKLREKGSVIFSHHNLSFYVSFLSFPRIFMPPKF